MVRLRKSASLLFGLLGSIFSASCGQIPEKQLEVAEGANALCIPPPIVVDPSRSLAITDINILEPRFNLQRVFNQIRTTAGVATPPADIYRSIFDTNNPVGFLPAPQQHCTGTLNGFPVDCPRQEGTLADGFHQPFCTGPGCDPYRPIGLFSRFDLAPTGGANCGEYRIVYGKTSGFTNPLDRNLIIFEAVLPNPKPGCGLEGLEGCAPVARFFANLSNEPDPVIRATLLENFYFVGLPGFAPVVHWSHYSGSMGQIRTNQFMTATAGEPWQLREYKLVQDCSAGCMLKADMMTVKNNPFATLFTPGGGGALGIAFRDPANPNGFFPQLSTLSATASVNDISMSINDMFNEGQSTAVALDDTDYLAAHGGGGAFGTNIEANPAVFAAGLTRFDVMRRAMTQSCAGCHQLSNGAPLGAGLTWPSSLGFVHVSDRVIVPCATPGGCWQISPALLTEFLPRRSARLASYVTATWCSAPCP